MSLDPRSIATEGLGSTPLAVALAGFVPVEEQPPIAPRSDRMGGSAGVQGRGYLSLSDYRRLFGHERPEAVDAIANPVTEPQAVSATNRKRTRRRREAEEMLVAAAELDA